MIVEIYNYKLLSTGESSNKLGNCEVCGKYCSEVFSQSEERLYFNPIKQILSWTFHNCFSYFGHKACLFSKRRFNN